MTAWTTNIKEHGLLPVRGARKKLRKSQKWMKSGVVEESDMQNLCLAYPRRHSELIREAPIVKRRNSKNSWTRSYGDFQKRTAKKKKWSKSGDCSMIFSSVFNENWFRLKKTRFLKTCVLLPPTGRLRQKFPKSKGLRNFRLPPALRGPLRGGCASHLLRFLFFIFLSFLMARRRREKFFGGPMTSVAWARTGFSDVLASLA